MTELPGFSAHDRVLVAAPHPDDEAIATGGVLQAARAAGAACRVIVVTDGDNNPWPQRWIEKRWHIGAADRARWGARRRSEALAALDVLGVDASDARCLGFPDLGLTDVLMSGGGLLETRLAAELREFRPTCLFLPALGDRHPDHSAVHVMLQLAWREAGFDPPQTFAFGVHGTAPGPDDVLLRLTPQQQASKRAAIERHETQMRLSRRRFVAYARSEERFRRVDALASDPGHPLQARIADGRLQVRLRGGPSRAAMLHLVLRGAITSRCRVTLFGEAAGERVDTVSGRQLPPVPVSVSRGELQLELPAGTQSATAWLKVAPAGPGLFVLDRHGWQVTHGVP